jgi:hypothetical protein
MLGQSIELTPVVVRQQVNDCTLARPEKAIGGSRGKGERESRGKRLIGRHNRRNRVEK